MVTQIRLSLAPYIKPPPTPTDISLHLIDLNVLTKHCYLNSDNLKKSVRIVQKFRPKKRLCLEYYS